jgi:hypothetical protein
MESSIDTYNFKKWECHPKTFIKHLGSNERGPRELFGDKLLTQFDLECASDNCACIYDGMGIWKCTQKHMHA